MFLGEGVLLTRDGITAARTVDLTKHLLVCSFFILLSLTLLLSQLLINLVHGHRALPLGNESPSGRLRRTLILGLRLSGL